MLDPIFFDGNHQDDGCQGQPEHERLSILDEPSPTDQDYIDAVRLFQPEHEWLRVILEVLSSGEPQRRPRSLEGAMEFPPSEDRKYGDLDPRQLWILAAWHLAEFYGVRVDLEVGTWGGRERRKMEWHYSVLCSIHAALGDEFERRLGGLIQRYNERHRPSCEAYLHQINEEYAARKERSAVRDV
jgi:hypothetical protein